METWFLNIYLGLKLKSTYLKDKGLTIADEIFATQAFIASSKQVFKSFKQLSLFSQNKDLVKPRLGIPRFWFKNLGFEFISCQFDFSILNFWR